MGKNKVTVKINDTEYTLMGDDSEEYLFSIANHVDKKIREILSSNPKHSPTSSAVLTALTITDEMFKLKKEVENIKNNYSVPTEKLKELEDKYKSLYNEYVNINNENKKIKDSLNESLLREKENIEKIHQLQVELQKSIKEYEALLKENAFLRERNEEVEIQLKETREMLTSVKEQLLESQIELVKVKKDLKDFKELQIKKRTV